MLATQWALNLQTTVTLGKTLNKPAKINEDDPMMIDYFAPSLTTEIQR